MLPDTPPPGVTDLAWRICTSPIEKALLRGLVEAAQNVVVNLSIITDLRAVTLDLPGVLVVPQCKACNHTVDFLVCTPWVGIAVECDGQRWHSRADQSRYDRAVDRALQRAGYRVYRFTGEDIWKNAQGCAETVLGDLLLWDAEVQHRAGAPGSLPGVVTAATGPMASPGRGLGGGTR